MLARRRAISIAGFHAIMCVAVFVGVVRADCPPTWHSALPVAGADRDINASTTWDPDGPGPLAERLVIGGRFRVAGTAVSYGVAAFDGIDWHEMTGGVSPIEIWALHVHNGELYAGGQFNDGFGNSRAVAVWRDSQWQLVGDGLTIAAFALTTHNDELVAGGWLRDLDSNGARNLARWTGSEWLPIGGGAGEDFDERVYALRSYNGDLYVGGELYRVGGVSRRGLARWDGSQWHTVGGRVNSYVLCLAEYDGKLIVGGAFNYVADGTLNVGRIAAWDGAQWSALGGGVGPSDRPDSFGVPWTMIVRDGLLYVGGTFSEFDSCHGRRVASWNGTSWSAIGSGCDNNVNALAAFQGHVVAGGVFFNAGSASVRRLAKWNGTDWSSVGDPRSAIVTEMTLHNGIPHAVGQFVDASGVAHHGAAVWDGEQWQPIAGSFSFANGFQGAMYSVASHGGELIVGGRFDLVGGEPVNNVARWNGAMWQPLGSGTNGSVSALLSHTIGLITGGNFTDAGGAYRPRVARWDGAAWQSMTNELDGFNNLVDVLALHGGEIVAGGSFVGFGSGQALNRIARWDGAHWRPLGSGVTGASLSTDVYAIASIGNDLFAGGRFATAGGVTVGNSARWDGSGWSATDAFDSWILSSAVLDGELIAGGLFTTISGQYLPYVARRSEIGWEALGSGVNNQVRRLLVAGDQLFAAGEFSVAGDRAAGGYAVFGPPPMCDGDVNCDQHVELTDLATLLIHFGTPSGATRAMGDFDADGDVDLIDLATLLSNFGAACG